MVLLNRKTTDSSKIFLSCVRLMSWKWDTFSKMYIFPDAGLMFWNTKNFGTEVNWRALKRFLCYQFYYLKVLVPIRIVNYEMFAYGVDCFKTIYYPLIHWEEKTEYKWSLGVWNNMWVQKHQSETLCFASFTPHGSGKFVVSQNWTDNKCVEWKNCMMIGWRWIFWFLIQNCYHLMSRLLQ